MRAGAAFGLVVSVVVGSVLAAVPLPAGAAEGELDEARERANAVAAELAEAQTRLAELEGEAAALEARASEGESRRLALVEAARALAIDRFMRSGPPPVPMLDGDLNAAVRANALSSFVARDRADALDEFRRAGEDLALARAALAGVAGEAAAALEEVGRQVEEADRRLAELQRLEAERRAAEAARRAEEAARRAEDEASRAARPGAGSPGGGRAGQSSGGSGGSRGAPTSPGAATRRGAAPGLAAPVATGAWVCPVQGPRAFTNDWGQPRSGGRRHQGNDILSLRGTPVVANVSGRVRPHQSGLGGISYYLTGDDGNTYYGTHLDSLSGASGPVAQGEVLGYVGNSGNAAGGPTHLHFEIHPGGGGAVNPFPTLSRYC